MSKWDMRYLDLAESVSTWSKDPSTKIGAVAVGSKGQVLSQGYNGFPRGIADTDDRLEDRDLKYKYVVHGEMNAIYNACHTGVSLNGAALYIHGLPPCAECAKGIIQVGINTVVARYPKSASPMWLESSKTAREMFAEAHVAFICHEV